MIPVIRYWNYRVIRYRDGSGYGLHEVHYDDGKPVMMTEHPIDFVASIEEGAKGVLASLRRAFASVYDSEPLDEAEVMTVLP